MSVALPSPHHGKRFLEEDNQPQQEDERLPFGEYNPQKRVRHVVSPSGRCGSTQLRHNPSYVVGASTFAALRALFPSMSDKVIADTLAEFGDNIDAAIKHLNNLQLSAPGTSKQHAILEQQRLGILGPPPPQAATAAAAVAATAAPVNPAAAQASADETSAPSTSAPVQSPQPPSRTAEEWIELLVQQMSAATDVADAKQRASQVLRAFEQAVMQHSDQQVGDVSRENALLKRAVAIQNSRLQELLAREAEANELRTALEAAKSRIQSLEVQNYSLQLHLKRAADAQQDTALTPGRNNPDVF